MLTIARVAKIFFIWIILNVQKMDVCNRRIATRL